MLHNIPFLDRAVQTAPLRRIHRRLLALPPLRRRPPAGQDAVPRLRQVQELSEVGQRVVVVVEAAGIGGEDVIVFDAHAVAVDELAEGVFFGELV